MSQRRKPSPQTAGTQSGVPRPPAPRQPALTADSRPNRPRDAKEPRPAVTFTDWAMI